MKELKGTTVTPDQRQLTSLTLNTTFRKVTHLRSLFPSYAP